MAVNWDFRAEKGFVYFKGTDDNVKGKKIKWHFYQANCLGCFTREYKEDGKDMYAFMTFYNDLDHLKRCLGLKKLWDGRLENVFDDYYANFKPYKIKLNVYYKDNLKIAECFVRAGYKVELYYKDIDAIMKKSKGKTNE